MYEIMEHHHAITVNPTTTFFLKGESYTCQNYSPLMAEKA
jgi:hypothetical protein